MKIKYMGFTVVQSNCNNHILLYINDNLKMHVSATREFSKEELEDLVRFYLTMKDSIKND